MIIKTYNEVAGYAKELATIFKSNFEEADFIIGISRGGLFPAAMIATQLNKPLIAAYIDKQDNVYLDRTDWIVGKKVIIVDDAVRTGKTLNKIIELVRDANAASWDTAVLFTLRGAEQSQLAEEPLTIAGDLEDNVVFPWDD